MMTQEYLKHFAVIFSLLLIFQQGHTLIQNKIIEDGVQDVVPGNKRTVLHSVAKDQKREKRFFFTAILIFVTVASISTEVYKQARGCKDITPDLEPTVEKGKKLEKEVNELRESAENAWKPLTSDQEYNDKLDKQLVEIRERVHTYKTLLNEIVTYLDRDLLDKDNLVLRKLENDIDGEKEESIGSMEDLTAKVASASEFAISMTAKMITLGVATKSLLYKSTSKVAAVKASEWAAANSGRVSNMLTRFSQAKGALSQWTSTQVATFNAGLSSKFAGSVGLKLARFNTLFTKLGQTTAGKALSSAISITGKAIVKTGASIAAVILFAYDIWKLVEFVNECHKKLRDAKDAVTKMEENKADIVKISNDIANLHEQVKQNYNDMKYCEQCIAGQEFLNFLGEIIELAKGAQHQTIDIALAIGRLNGYIKYIHMDYKGFTDAMNDNLIHEVFDKINYRLECLKSKINIRMSVVDKCEDGIDSFSVLYNQAKSLESTTITDDCIEGEYMSESEIQGLIEEAMKKKGAQKICIRNNQDFQKLACTNFHSQHSNSQNAQLVGVSVADIEYFLTKCDTKDLSRTQKLQICAKKTEGDTFDQVKMIFHSLYYPQVKIVYDECDISDPEKISICYLKASGYDLNYVESKYNLYPSSKVQEVFNGCQQSTELTPEDKKKVCSWKEHGLLINDSTYASLWQLMFTKYSEQIVESHYNSCP